MKLSRKVFAASAMMLIAGFAFAQSEKESSVESEYLNDVDGDITENIEVNLIPSLDVTNGRVTPTETGDYEVQYKVADKSGNVAEAFATLTVNPHLAEKTVYKEYSFIIDKVKELYQNLLVRVIIRYLAKQMAKHGMLSLLVK